MGLRDKLRQLQKDSSPGGGSIELQKRPKQIYLTPPGQVTEQSLQVWRTLPAEIRHDPSMASFQMENERLHGSSAPTDDESSTQLNDIESSPEEDHSHESSEFISMMQLESNRENGLEDKSDIEPELTEKCKGISFKAQEKLKFKQRRLRQRRWKRTGLLICWLFSAIVLILVEEKHLLEKTLEVSHNTLKNFKLPTNPTGNFKLKVFGTFSEKIKSCPFNDTGNILTIQPQISSYSSAGNTSMEYTDILKPWRIALGAEECFDTAPVVSRNITYRMPDDILESLASNGSAMRLLMYTNVDKDMAIKLIYNPFIVNVKTGTLLAAFILLIFYALLVWEVFERTFVAVMCSILSIAVLACFHDRPNMEEIVQWMDMEMLTLLFCMMIIVAILTETGVFDYVAVVAFEISGGKIWPMIYSLCVITCCVSSFLDNMTTVLLMTPVAIRLCEVMSLDPVPVLMGIIVHSNIGGAVTPIGDPISIIISSNHYIAQNGVTFMTFVAHTTPGVILAVIQSCLYLRFVFRNIESLRLNEPKELKDLRREIKVWQRAANSISSFSKDADLVRITIIKKVKVLKQSLRRKQRGLTSTDAYVHTLEDLKLKYPIKNKVLLQQTCSALIFVIICFFIQSVPQLRTLPLGWVALLGVIVLLIVMNREDIEFLMHRVEWTTLLFFAAMFVMMECVERLGLFSWIGELTENIILFVDKKNRLAMAIFIILWISALASAILDSIPVTAMMVKVVVSLVAKESLGLPLQPLVWALVFGPCLGGNGTLYGASSNVISAGIAEQHGYKISFTRYLKIVFPMMLSQITIITGYLMVSHILFGWN